MIWYNINRLKPIGSFQWINSDWNLEIIHEENADKIRHPGNKSNNIITVITYKPMDDTLQNEEKQKLSLKYLEQDSNIYS